MALTPAQIIDIALAAKITRGEAQIRAALLDADGQTAMTSLLTEWRTAKRKFSRLNGKIAGYETDTVGKRLAIINDIRALLSLPQLQSETGAASLQTGAIGSSNGRTAVDF